MAWFAAAWSWFSGTKIGRWIIGAALVIAGLLAALAIAFVKGKQSQASVDDAKDAQSMADAAEQVVKAARTRAEVENEVAKEPVAPPQKVADAAPDTAAGKLRDDGWTH